jgi:hypothetical protein
MSISDDIAELREENAGLRERLARIETGMAERDRAGGAALTSQVAVNARLADAVDGLRLSLAKRDGAEGAVGRWQGWILPAGLALALRELAFKMGWVH